MIKLIIVDDHQLMIDGIKTALSEYEEIKIIGDALNGRKLLELLKSKTPDIILLDIMMPELDGIDTLQIVKQKNPEVKIIMLSQFGDRGFIKRCLKFGADGYLLKDCGGKKLIKTIRDIYKGGTVFDVHVTSQLKSAVKVDLSNQEKEVLHLIVQGVKNKEIANFLNISVSTVSTYRSRIMEKIGVRTDIELYEWVKENEIV